VHQGEEGHACIAIEGGWWVVVQSRMSEAGMQNEEQEIHNIQLPTSCVGTIDKIMGMLMATHTGQLIRKITWKKPPNRGMKTIAPNGILLSWFIELFPIDNGKINPFSKFSSFNSAKFSTIGRISGKI
jgi:hypothetical protein